MGILDRNMSMPEFNATTVATIAGGAIVTGLFLQSVRPMPIFTPDEEELFGEGTFSPDPAAAVGAPWNCSPDACATIQKGERGQASAEAVTVMQSFKSAAEKHAEDPAFRRDVAKPTPEAIKKLSWEPEWEVVNWQQYYDQSLQTGRCLMALGIEQFDTVAIIGFNSPEWFLSNMGAIACGGKAAGIYATNGPEACQYIAEHSQAKVVLCDSVKHLAKFVEVLNGSASSLPALQHIVMWSDEVPEDLQAGVRGVNIISWADFQKKGDQIAMDQLQARIDAQMPGHPCTLIYTSGTTGNPKAVMITHDNCTWTATAMLEYVNQTGTPFGHEEERVVSYLPLSHIAAQMLDLHMPICTAASADLEGYTMVTFARPDAMRGTLKHTLQKTEPTQFFGVPRVWEKFQEAIVGVGKAGSPMIKRISAWAKAKGLEGYQNSQNGSDKKPWGHAIASKLVHSKVKAALGLSKCKAAYTGAAPIAPVTLDFFGSLGIHVLELYGMSECSGPQTVSAPCFHKRGSCGHAIPGCEMAILTISEDGKAPTRMPVGEEGEICFRGRHVMLGYMQGMKRDEDSDVLSSDAEMIQGKTAESIDEFGWLHSGDKGKVDEDGMLFITGRYKELLITAGGENIAPVPVENAIKEALGGLIEEVVMVADKRKFCSCIFTLKAKPGMNNDGQSTFTDVLDGAAATLDPEATTVTAATGDWYKGTDKWRAALQAGIDVYNKNPVSQAAKINSFRICSEGFSVGNGMLTDTMKLKKAKVFVAQGPLIELMYAEADMGMADNGAKKAKTDQEKADAAEAQAEANAKLQQARTVVEAAYKK